MKMVNEKERQRIEEIAQRVKGLSDDELREIVKQYSELRRSPSGYHLGQSAMSEIRRRSDTKLDKYATAAQRYCSDYMLGEEVKPERGMCYNCELIGKPECPYDRLPLPFLEVIVRLK